MLAAVLTVSGPWLPARWRHWWWALLLAFVPIHLVVSAIVPARSLLGLAVGWFVGALVVLVVGTPALEVPLDGAVRAMAKRGFVVSGLHGGPARPDRGRWCCRPHAGIPIRPAVDRVVRPASTQRRRTAPALAEAAAARRRDRAPADLDAPRRRASRADGHRHR